MRIDTSISMKRHTYHLRSSRRMLLDVHHNCQASPEFAYFNAINNILHHPIQLHLYTNVSQPENGTWVLQLVSSPYCKALQEHGNPHLLIDIQYQQESIVGFKTIVANTKVGLHIPCIIPGMGDKLQFTVHWDNSKCLEHGCMTCETTFLQISYHIPHSLQRSKRRIIPLCIA